MKALSTSLLTRRNILRGAGACIALPFLESLLPTARAQALAFPKRFVPIYFPNGADTLWWDMRIVPSTVGWEFSPVLAPFAPLQGKAILFDGLANYRWGSTDPGGVEPSHARQSGAFLTCLDVEPSTFDRIMTPFNSVDQEVAMHIGGATAIPSLQLGLNTVSVSACDGRSCDLSRSISWAQGTPLFKEVNPQAVFDRLFGSSETISPEEIERRRALNQSVLDYVVDSASALQPRLGAADREKVDQFLSSVRSVENRLAQVGISNCAVPTRPTLDASQDDATVVDDLVNGMNGYDRDTHAEVMNDLIVLALQCDLTRVVSHMLDDSRSNFVYDHVPITDFGGTSLGSTTAGDFHGVSSQSSPSNDFASINHWLNQKVANLCSKLEAVSEGDRTLLDNTVVFYASHMDGAPHRGDHLPALLLGGTGIFKSAQWAQFPATPDDPQFRDLFFTIMNSFFELQVGDFGHDVENRTIRSMSEILV
jgi:hypothetical protein